MNGFTPYPVIHFEEFYKLKYRKCIRLSLAYQREDEVEAGHILVSDYPPTPLLMTSVFEVTFQKGHGERSYYVLKAKKAPFL